MQQTETYWNLINRIVIIAIFIMVGVGAILMFGPKVQEMKAFEKTLKKKEGRAAAEKTNGRTFSEKSRRFTSDSEFAERVLHEQGFVHKDEISYQFPDDETERR